MKVIIVPQLSDFWWEAHRGLVSASNFDRIITPSKGDLSKQADDFIDELIGDVLNQTPNYFTQKGRPINSYAAEQGRDREPEARRWLAMDAGLDVAEVGICLTDDLSFGSSPDGLIGMNLNPESSGTFNGHPYFDATCTAAVELKVPLLSTHLGYLRKGVLPVVYKPQCHGHLLVTGAAYCEFVSYGFVENVRPLRVKVERNEYTDKVEKAVKEFVAMYTEALAKVRQR